MVLSRALFKFHAIVWNSRITVPQMGPTRQVDAKVIKSTLSYEFEGVEMEF